jgi:hypothetical protein
MEQQIKQFSGEAVFKEGEINRLDQELAIWKQKFDAEKENAT